MSTAVCFYFEVHQPFRLRPYHFFDIGHSGNYFDDARNRQIMQKVTHKCYLPATRLLRRLVDRYGGDFRISYSISGTALEQFELYAPEVLDEFRALAATGHVDFLAETYYHSLSALFSEREFRAQVEAQTSALKRLFGVEPRSFRNTELIFNNHIAWLAGELGFKAVLAEGIERMLGWRSPNFPYRPRYRRDIVALLKNYRLSDDIAFRFSQKSWSEHPLTAEKFARWCHEVAGNGTIINLFMDYETLGEHQWEDTGIFQFMEKLPELILRHPDYRFLTVTEAATELQTVGEIESDDPISWADTERDVSAWLGNSIQNTAIHALYEIEEAIYDRDDGELFHTFRKLQTSDHFYYMCTKYFNDGDVHKYFSPYGTPHEAYVYFMNALADLRERLHLTPLKVNV
ncbi:MAG: polysaccharide deacetylase family protein [Spirochaetales bacterium]|nr:polysaccharide deacetylase family protein [Spirochaetales bacterium]